MIKITKTNDEYTFEREDEGGVLWSLGNATIRKQDEGTDDEESWFEGYFDTQAISFEDDDELVRIIKKRKGNAEEVRFA